MKIVFTTHAEFRIIKRKVSHEEIIYAIKYPDMIVKKYGKYYYQKRFDRGIIEVVTEKTENNIKIITVYWL